MHIRAILLPVFLEVGLIFVLLGFLGKARSEGLRRGIRSRDVALDDDAFPAGTRQIGNAYANQFEIPLLFIAAVILGIVVRQAGTIFILVEWVFVFARIGHAIVHTTSNDVSLRGKLFGLSAAATALLWILLAVGILFGAL